MNIEIKKILEGMVTNFSPLIISAVQIPIVMSKYGSDALGLLAVMGVASALTLLTVLGPSSHLLSTLSRNGGDPVSIPLFNLYLRKSVIFGFLFGIPATVYVLSRSQQMDLTEIVTPIFIMFLIRPVIELQNSSIIGIGASRALSYRNLFSAIFHAIFLLLLIQDVEFPTYILFLGALSIFEVLFNYFLLRVRLPFIDTNNVSAPDLINPDGRNFVRRVFLNGGLWMVLMQMDKLILSFTISQKELGWYSATIALAGMLPVLATSLTIPYSKVIGGTLSKSECEREFFLVKYLSFSFSLLAFLLIEFAFNSTQLLSIWIGTLNVNEWHQRVFFVALVNSMLQSCMAIVSSLQLAKGDSSVYGKSFKFLAFVHAPLIVFSYATYGATVGLFFWSISNLLWMLFFTPTIVGLYLGRNPRYSSFCKTTATLLIVNVLSFETLWCGLKLLISTPYSAPIFVLCFGGCFVASLTISTLIANRGAQIV